MTNMMAPAGPAAAHLAHLGWWILGTFTAVMDYMDTVDGEPED